MLYVLGVVLKRLDDQEDATKEERSEQEADEMTLRLLICAERTAMAIVKLLQISTAVLAAPILTFMNSLVAAKAAGTSRGKPHRQRTCRRRKGLP